jgi:hypothetical protein
MIASHLHRSALARMQRNVTSLQLQGRNNPCNDHLLIANNNRDLFERQSNISRPLTGTRRESPAMHQETSKSIIEQGAGDPSQHQHEDRPRSGRTTLPMQRSTSSTVTYQFHDILFDPRGVDDILSIDCEILDDNFNKIPVDNFQEEDHYNQEDQTRPEETSVARDNQQPQAEQHHQIERRRKRNQSNKNGNWSTKNLEEALNNINEGMSIQLATKLARIPALSVRDHYTGKTRGRKRGPAGILTTKEEEDLKLYLLKLHNLGHPLTRNQVKLTMARVTQSRPTPFKNGILGNRWMRWFLNRNPELTF